MKGIFGEDTRRINHALNVLSNAEAINSKENGDEITVITAAILHDIGIQEAERKHGSSAGNYQEIEGPPIARRILSNLDIPDETVEHICRIIGSHHSANDIDTIEFRVIWDSDWIVNIPDEFPDYGREKTEELIGKIMKTCSGRDRAREVLL
ncbi:MAG: HD domain-containing protein [Planctomycetes bacterium]|nr:HD domain-containing protein [Planctomycetota bacterium]